MGVVLSIAVPCYNVEQYLRRSLEPYCDERFRNRLEVILVDDGSTDGTAGLLAEFGQREPDIFRIITKQNGGHGSAVNAGLAVATGRYFRIVDGDDWVNTDGLDQELETLAACTADLVVDERREVHMQTGEGTFYPLPRELSFGTEQPFAPIATDGVLMGKAVDIHTLVLRTDFARSIELTLLEHTFYVDYEFITKATVRAKTIMFLDVEVYQYLVGNPNQSVSAANYVRRWDNHDRVVREILAFARRMGDAGIISPDMQAYAQHRADLIINSHYNIMLIFDKDRKRGAARARAFRRWLGAKYPERKAATDKRYLEAWALHRLGVDAVKLEKLMGNAKRQ